MSGPVSRRQEPARSSVCSSDPEQCRGRRKKRKRKAGRLSEEDSRRRGRAEESGGWMVWSPAWATGWEVAENRRVSSGEKKQAGIMFHRRGPPSLQPYVSPSPGHRSDSPRDTSAFLSFLFLHPHQEGPFNGHSSACPQKRTPRWLFADPEVQQGTGPLGCAPGWQQGTEEQASARLSPAASAHPPSAWPGLHDSGPCIWE